MYRFDRKKDGGTGSWLPGIRALAIIRAQGGALPQLHYFLPSIKLNTGLLRGVFTSPARVGKLVIGQRNLRGRRVDNFDLAHGRLVAPLNIGDDFFNGIQPGDAV